jgi:hypothetical protein
MFEFIARYMNSPYIFVQLWSKLNNEIDFKHHHLHPTPTKTVRALQTMLQGFLLFKNCNAIKLNSNQSYPGLG